MPGSRGQGFGRKKGMGSGTGRNATIAGALFGWIKSQAQSKNCPDRTVAHRPVIENPSRSDELGGLKKMAESIQTQLDEVRSRIHEIDKFPLARIDDAVCAGCGRCASICPAGAIVQINRIPQVDRNKCTGCGICVSECPVGAINLVE